MRTFFSLLFLLIYSVSYTQDTLWCDKSQEQVENRLQADYYKLVEFLSTDSTKSVVRRYNLQHVLKDETPYSNYKKEILGGVYKQWYENGQLKSFFTYKNNLLDGSVESFFENGLVRRKSTYKNGLLQEGFCLNESGEKVKYYEPSTEASFPGGTDKMISFISKKLKYPRDCVELNIEGRVLVSFIVETNGKITNVKILKSANKSLDKEAMRVVKSMKKWTPGTTEGVKVRTKCRIPIKFALN